MKRASIVVAVVILVLLMAPPAADAQGPVQSYVVKPGDTIYSIAAKFCTSWQEIYRINRAVIGPNPNVLRSGTVLRVPSQCGGAVTPSPGGGVYDRGPRPHAQGTVAGNVYTVARGDTLFSIGQRFGLSTQQLASANGLGHPWWIFPGQTLVIPGLTPPVTTPTPTRPTPTSTPIGPTPTSTPIGPTPTATPTPIRAFLTITSPTAGAAVPLTFTASGSGGGLFEGNVVVEARNSAGQVLAQRATTLQGNNVGAGGTGTWTTTLTVNVPAGTPGSVVAYSPQTPSAFASVPVSFGGSPTPTYKDFYPGECTITGIPGTPVYAYPNGPQNGIFGVGATYGVVQGAKLNGQFWYSIRPDPNAGSPVFWVPTTSIASAVGNCLW